MGGGVGPVLQVGQATAPLFKWPKVANDNIDKETFFDLRVILLDPC